MYSAFYTKRFSKSLKKIEKAGFYDINIIRDFIKLLSSGKKLDSKYRDHKLTGDYEGYRECHIKPDLLLIYQIKDKELFWS